MLAKLKQLEDVLEITDVRSSHELKDMGNINDQLVISTGGISRWRDTKYSHGQSPAGTGGHLQNPEERRLRLKRKLGPEARRQRQENFSKNKKRPRGIPWSYCSRQTGFLALKQGGAQSWEGESQGSRQASLHESGAVTYEYIEAMVENIKVNGSYVVIYSGIAAPHAEAGKRGRQRGEPVWVEPEKTGSIWEQ